MIYYHHQYLYVLIGYLLVDLKEEHFSHFLPKFLLKLTIFQDQLFDYSFHYAIVQYLNFFVPIYQQVMSPLQ